MVGATAGGIATFNVQHGYVEALVRGFRSGFLDDVDYHHLTQCESLEGTMRGATGRRFFIFTWFQYAVGLLGENGDCGVCADVCVSLSSPYVYIDVKLNLQETDYDQFLADEASGVVRVCGFAIAIGIAPTSHLLSTYCAHVYVCVDNLLSAEVAGYDLTRIDPRRHDQQTR